MHAKVTTIKLPGVGKGDKLFYKNILIPRKIDSGQVDDKKMIFGFQIFPILYCVRFKKKMIYSVKKLSASNPPYEVGKPHVFFIHN